MTMEPIHDPGRTMFVQVAGRAVLDGPSLTLLELAPATLFVTEEPTSAVGYLPTGLFLDRWYEDAGGAGTHAVPAVLSLLDPDRTQASDVRLTVGLPRIRGTGVEYQVRVLQGEVPQEAGACVLFIRPPLPPTTPERWMSATPRGDVAVDAG